MKKLLLCSLALSTLLTLACGDDEPTQAAPARTDASLCAEICAETPQSCPAFYEDLGGDRATCEELCLNTEDSSTAFRQCMADSADCDGLADCKSMF